MAELINLIGLDHSIVVAITLFAFSVIVTLLAIILIIYVAFIKKED